MKNTLYRFTLVLLLMTSGAGVVAQNIGGSLTNDYINYFDQQVPQKADRQFQFIAYFINQAVSSNFYPENVFMKGQVIGRLFGDNTTHTTDSATAFYFEQRLIPFFIYQPNLFDGKATLRASFEIDWTWGDQAYGTGGNLGGAISADQVNIQTQNLEIEYKPVTGLTFNLGLQRLFDTPYDPYRTFFEKMSETGYRLMYWGTDAVGLRIHKENDFSRWTAAYYQLYENDILDNDDVTLQYLSYQNDIAPKWSLGGSVYYLRDRGNGEGGVSIYGQGLNSRLTQYNGTFRFDFDNAYKADILWLGTHFSRNAEFMLDRFRLTGFANYNLGWTRVKQAGDDYDKAADIGGLGANLRMGYRFGQTTEDAVNVGVTFATGDENALADDKYSGVITGNTWGAPAGIFISSGSYILFPHGNVVNRFTPLIADLSNMGYGLLGGTFNASRAFIPYKLIGKVGTAAAMSNVAPSGGGNNIGLEVNGFLKYQIGVYMSLEMHGAYVWLGDFYESNDNSYSYYVNGNTESEQPKPVNPWTAFLVFKWLMF
ncbi:MAG: hypothetical protein ACLFPE_02745 [Bacteroidales bacterium]